VAGANAAAAGVATRVVASFAEWARGPGSQAGRMCTSIAIARSMRRIFSIFGVCAMSLIATVALWRGDVLARMGVRSPAFDGVIDGLI